MRVPEITAVPDSPAYIEGVINLRGKIVSVVDLRKRFSKPATELDPPQPHSGRRARRPLVGMIVDAASEVLKIPKATLIPRPP